MYGGLIAECAGTGTAGPDYDGAVYLNGSGVNFWMYRGTIAGNTSAGSVAGVSVYNGTFRPGLSACVTNNVGGYANDVLLKPIYGKLVFNTEKGNFTGRMTLHVEAEPTEGALVYPTMYSWCSRGYPVVGLGNVVCEQWPQYVMDGRTLADGYYQKWVLRDADIVNRSVSGCWDEVWPQCTSGDHLRLCRDVTVTQTLEVVNKSQVVFDGAGHRVVRATDKALFKCQYGSVSFRDVLLDGNGLNGTESVLNVIGCGVTLDAGAVIENAKSGSAPVAVSIRGNGMVFEMKDGAVIRNCASSNANEFGMLVRIGDGTTYEKFPVFRMSGGAITNNAGETVRDPSGYGGMVYCYRGDFEMSGGTISGNSCSNSSSGVNVYKGAITLSGTARIENNLPSTYPDVYLNSSGCTSAVLVGDFRGHVGVSSCANQVNAWTGFTCAEGATGACRLFGAAGSAYNSLTAYLYDNDRKIYLYTPVAWVDGIGWPQYGTGGCIHEELSSLMPESVALGASMPADIPHTLKGEAARTYSGNMNVTFDPEAFQASPALPVTLLKTVDGPFTGTWTFDVPQPRRGTWQVSKVGGTDGTEAYVLNYCKPGLSVLIR